MKKRINRVLAIFLAVLMIALTLPVAFAYISTGSCGNNVKYSYNTDTGVLTLTGYGKTSDFSDSPWRNYSVSPKTCTIQSGITRIGNSLFSSLYKMESCSVPDTVQSFGTNAFYNCNRLKSIHIPSGVTIIPKYCFYQCNSLNSIDLPNTVESIGEYAFYGCSGATSITIPDSVTYIDSNAFQNCSSVTEISIPDSVTTLGQSAFSGCSDLQKVTIGTGVTKLPLGVFQNCIDLKIVNLPDTLTTVGYKAFSGCNSLSTINIPEGITYIDSYAFENCSSLKSIYLPKSLTEFSSYYSSDIFYKCNLLKDVYYAGTEAEWNAVGYHNAIPSTATIHFNAKPKVKTDLADGIYLYSAMPALTMSKGVVNSAALQAVKDGYLVDDYSFSVVSSNSSVVTVDGFSNDDVYMTFNMTAKNAGQAKLTITEATSKQSYSVNVEVSSGKRIFNADYLPTYYERNQAYNCYSSGLYVADFQKTQQSDGSYLANFDVYNALNVMGVVNVYDANNQLVETRPIERFKGNAAESIKDALWNLGMVFYEAFNGDLLTFKQDSYAKKTSVKNLAVPAGGHIEISNNMLKAEWCGAFNLINFVVEGMFTFCSELNTYANFDALKLDASAEIMKQLKKQPKDVLVKFGKKAAELAGKKVTIHTATDLIIDAAQSGLDILNDGGIDVKKILKDSAVKVGTKIPENILVGALGSYGFIFKGLFTYSKAINLTSWYIDMCKNRVEDQINIYFNKNGKLSDNGVTVQSTDSSQSLTNANYVMHSIVIEEVNDASAVVKPTLDKLGTKYELRNIYLERDGVISQPNQNVQVSVPIPAGFDQSKSVIYWIKDDGTAVLMNTTVENGYLTFYTDHFSYYAVVEVTGDAPAVVTPDTPATSEQQEEDNADLCPWCGQEHTGFFGGIVAFFHRIFARLFGAKY